MMRTDKSNDFSFDHFGLSLVEVREVSLEPSKSFIARLLGHLAALKKGDRPAYALSGIEDVVALEARGLHEQRAMTASARRAASLIERI